MADVPSLHFAVMIQPLPAMFRRRHRLLDLDRAIAWRATHLLGSKYEGVHYAVAANLDCYTPGSGNRARRRIAAIDAEAKRRELCAWYDDCDRRGISTGD